MNKVDRAIGEHNKLIADMEDVLVLEGTKECKEHKDIHSNCSGCISEKGCKIAYERMFCI